MQCAILPPLTAAALSPASVEIAPGVVMPYVNLGGVHSHQSNYSAWLEVGGRGLDSALMYGDDVQLSVGNAIESSGLARDELFVTTKVPCCPALNDNTGIGSSWCKWYASEYALLDVGTDAAIDLRLLGLENVDLMLLHWPCDTMDETVAAYRRLEDFALAGKARAIGISNFNTSAIEGLFASGLRVPPRINQCGFSIGHHNETALGSDMATVRTCRDKNITYSAYSPLGGLSDVDVLSDPTVVATAQKYNKATAQVALRWVVQQGIVAVTASTKASHLVSDLGIFDFALSPADMDALSRI